METLCTKLYNNYIKLKKEKDTEMEKLCGEQEVKFMNYVTVSVEMIELLRSENERLREQVSELRSDIDSIRSTKNEECIQLHARLMEENRNYKELAKEIERLCSLQREGRCCQARDDKVDNGPVDVPGSSQAESHSSDVVSVKKARKRSRQSLYRRHDKYNPSASEELEHAQLNVSANGSCKQTEANDAPPKYYQPACSKRKINNSGNDVTDCAPACCLFQDLIEFVVGMKLSIIAQNEEFCVSVLHPSSGEKSFDLQRKQTLVYRPGVLGIPWTYGL